jgi:hypothetical protein
MAKKSAKKNKVIKKNKEKEAESGGIIWFLQALAHRIPWFDIFMGLFIPLNTMHFLMYLKKPLAGVAVAFFWSLLYALLSFVIKKKPSMLGIMTAFMILINFAANFLVNHPVLFFVVEMLDNSLMGIAFLISLFAATPLVLIFIEKETLDRMPADIKKTPYYIRAWKIITGAWGISFVGMAMLLTVLKLHHSPLVGIVDVISGWPLVVALFGFSVTFPKYYWENKLMES